MRILFLFLVSLPLGCDPEPAPKQRAQAPGEDFDYAHNVRIIVPLNGALVEETFVVKYEQGDDIADVQFELNGAAVTMLEHDPEGGSFVVSAAPGAQTLKMFGLDSDGQVVSEHQARLNVQDGDPSSDGGAAWVTITSPSDNDTVTNPVTFSVNFDPGIDRIELLADDWYLGDVNEDGLLTYTFTGTGFPRSIQAVGYDDGQRVASDTITLTVSDGNIPTDPDAQFNQIMMSVAESYPTDGSYGYYWPSSSSWLGHPSDIYYEGELYSSGDHLNRSYCVGLTFEVFMRSFEIADRQTGGSGSLNGMTIADLDDLRVLWFIVNLNGGENVDALVNYGLGEEITDLEDAQPGDVVQFWRHSGSGHNSLFVKWVRDETDQIVGLTYWSTQGSTDGVGYNTEYFGSSGGRINPSLVYLARPYMPTDWKAWF